MAPMNGPGILKRRKESCPCIWTSLVGLSLDLSHGYNFGSHAVPLALDGIPARPTGLASSAFSHGTQHNTYLVTMTVDRALTSGELLLSDLMKDKNDFALPSVLNCTSSLPRDATSKALHVVMMTLSYLSSTEH